MENPGTMLGCRHAWLGFVGLVALLTLSSHVHAQSWLADRKRTEGRGIRLGDFELHPGVGAEVGYYTNPFFSDRPQGSAAFPIAPHRFISTLGEERQELDPTERKPGWLKFSGGVSGTFQHYFEYAVRDAFNLDLRGDATIAPERPIS